MTTFEREDGMSIGSGGLSSVILRCGLGLGFLSAVADRFGLWGAFGQPNVEWGDFSRFLEYTHTLNWYLPADMIAPLGIIATAAETLFGLLLLVGWHTRATARLTALLLLTFGVAMTLALGVKAPLNFAVLTGVGGALLLANCERFPLSLDELLFHRTHSTAGGSIVASAGRRLVLAILVTSTLLAPRTSMAQEKITPLISNDVGAGNEGLMYTVDFPPGFASPVHRHNAHVSLYVLEGSVVMQVRGGTEMTLTPGQTFYEGPDDVHVVSRNASDTKPAKFIVFMIKDKDAPLLVPEK